VLFRHRLAEAAGGFLGRVGTETLFETALVFGAQGCGLLRLAALFEQLHVLGHERERVAAQHVGLDLLGALQQRHGLGGHALPLIGLGEIVQAGGDEDVVFGELRLADGEGLL
jgi:hypothetical protein